MADQTLPQLTQTQREALALVRAMSGPAPDRNAPGALMQRWGLEAQSTDDLLLDVGSLIGALAALAAIAFDSLDSRYPGARDVWLDAMETGVEA